MNGPWDKTAFARACRRFDDEVELGDSPLAGLPLGPPMDWGEIVRVAVEHDPEFTLLDLFCPKAGSPMIDDKPTPPNGAGLDFYKGPDLQASLKRFDQYRPVLFKGKNMHYILNSAVITSPGLYRYRLVTIDEAKEWLDCCDFLSTIGYEETARALSLLSGHEIPVNRTTIRMSVGDQALVFRLAFPPGERRVPADAKGRLSVDYILQHCEIGILQMTGIVS